MLQYPKRKGYNMILHDVNNGVLFHVKGETKVYRRENETLDGVVCTNGKGETVHFTGTKEVVRERKRKQV